jgi:hypothetical protein
MNGWTGVFPLKDTNKSSNKVADQLNDFYNMIGEWASESEG